MLCVVSLMDFFHNIFFSINLTWQNLWKTYLDSILSCFVIFMSIILLEIPENHTFIKLWGIFSLMKIFRYILFFYNFDKKGLDNKIFYPSYICIKDITL